MTRKLRVTTDIQFDYLSEDDEISIGSVNGGKYDQIGVTIIGGPRTDAIGAGGTMRERSFKRYLRDGWLVFID